MATMMASEFNVHFTEFAKVSSIPLVSKIHKSNTKGSKYLWKCYFVIALIAAVFMNFVLYNEYIRYHVLEVSSKESYAFNIGAFPSITVCAKSVTAGYTTLKIELNEFIQDVGWLRDHFQRRVTEEEFKMHHPYLGSCFTFNHGYNDNGVIHGTNGAYKFRIMNAFEKVIDGKLVTIQLNMRYAIHPVRTCAIRKLLKQTRVIDAPFDYNVYISIKKYIRLSLPYSSKCNKGGLKRIAHPYAPEVTIAQTYDDCVAECFENGNENPDVCNCSIPCLSYEYSIYERIANVHQAVRSLQLRDNPEEMRTVYGYCKYVGNVTQYQSCLDNFITVNFMAYTHDMEVITEVAKLDFQHVLCSIGGNLGMLLGVSVLSMVEITTFVVTFVSRILKKRTQVSTDK